MSRLKEAMELNNLKSDIEFGLTETAYYLRRNDEALDGLLKGDKT